MSLLSIQVNLVSLVGFGDTRLAMGGVGVVLRQWRVPRLMNGIAGT